MRRQSLTKTRWFAREQSLVQRIATALTTLHWNRHPENYNLCNSQGRKFVYATGGMNKRTVCCRQNARVTVQRMVLDVKWNCSGRRDGFENLLLTHVILLLNSEDNKEMWDTILCACELCNWWLTWYKLVWDKSWGTEMRVQYIGQNAYQGIYPLFLRPWSQLFDDCLSVLHFRAPSNLLKPQWWVY